MTALAAVLLAAAGCAKQEAGTQGPASLMSIEPEVENMTKATLITNATGLQGQGFGVSIYNEAGTAYKDKVSMEYKNGAWAPKDGTMDWKWPAGQAYAFYAWSPADLAVGSVTSTGVPAFSYSGIADQTDIMLGCYSGTGNNGAAPVKFSHALASVQFKTGTMTGLGNITGIELSGVATSGTCTPTMSGSSTTFAWSNLSGSGTLSQTGLSIASTTSGTAIGKSENDSYFLVLPQSAALTVTLTDDNGKTVTATIATPSLSVGHTAIYTINYEAGKGLNFTCELKDWIIDTDHDEDIEVEEIPQQPDDEIWYITSDGKVATFNSSAPFGGLTVVSNTYKNGKGIIKFSGALKTIGNQAWDSPNCFYQQQNLTKVYFPPQVESIGYNIIRNCYYLSEIYIPVSVTQLAYNFCWEWYVYGGEPDPCFGEPLYIIVGNNRQEVSKGAVVYITLGNGEQAHIGTMCFVEGTMISLSNGSSKKVEELTYDDDLLVWNFDAGKYDSAKLLWISKGRKEVEYYKITLSDGSTINLCGSDGNCHRLFNYTDKIFQYPTKMEIGTEIFTLNGIAKLVSVECIKEDVTYYNLITDRHINCFADGILTSCRYNNLYPIDENMKFVKESRKKRPYSEFKDSGISREWYNGLRLSEQTDSLDNIVKYVSERVAIQQPKPAPTFWQKLRTWWKSIFG